MSSRKQAVQALLRLERPLEDILRELRTYAWDSDEALVELTAPDVADILARFVAGKVSADEVEAWANEVEGRDDVGLRPVEESVLKEVVFALANPALTEPLTAVAAQRMLERLRGR